MPEHSRQWLDEIGMTDDLLASRVARAGSSVTPKSLPQDVRSDFEARSGYSADSVRVVESDLPDAVAAGAVTQGNTVHFPRGGYAPGSGEGRQMLMHELAHTVQQAEGGVRANRGGIINDSPALEHQADTAFSGPAPSATGQAALAALPSVGVGAPMQLAPPGGSERGRISKFFHKLIPHRNRSSGGASAPAASSSAPAAASSAPAAPARAPLPAALATAARGLNGLHSVRNDPNSMDQDLLANAQLTEEQLQAGMGFRERRKRRSDLEHRTEKQQKREFYDKVKAAENLHPMPIQDDRDALAEILALDPSSAAPGEREAIIREREQKIKALQERRELAEEEHFNQVYEEVASDPLLTPTSLADRIALKHRIKKAIRHNQKKAFKHMLLATEYVKMMQEHDNQTYDETQRRFVSSIPSQTGAGRRAGGGRAGGGRAGGGRAGGVALPGMTSSGRPTQAQLAQMEDPEKEFSLKDTLQKGHELADEYSGIALDTNDSVKDLREAFVLSPEQLARVKAAEEANERDPFASDFELLLRNELGTATSHFLSAAGLVSDISSIRDSAKAAHAARKMGDKDEMIKQSAQAVGSFFSMGGRINGYIPDSPDPVSCALSMGNNVSSIVAAGADVHSGRATKKAMQAQLDAGFQKGVQDENADKVKGYQTRQLARRQGHRKQVSGGFDIAKNVVGLGGNVAGLFAGPGTIIKLAATGLGLLGTLAQKITTGAMEKHGQHAMADEVLATNIQLQALSESGAWGLSQKDMRKILAKVTGSNNGQEMINRIAAMRAAELHSRIPTPPAPGTGNGGANAAGARSAAGIAGAAGAAASASRAGGANATGAAGAAGGAGATGTLTQEDKELLMGLGYTDESKFHNITVEALYAKLGGEGSWKNALMGGRRAHQIEKAKERKARAERFKQIGDERLAAIAAQQAAAAAQQGNAGGRGAGSAGGASGRQP